VAAFEADAAVAWHGNTSMLGAQSELHCAGHVLQFLAFAGWCTTKHRVAVVDPG